MPKPPVSLRFVVVLALSWTARGAAAANVCAETVPASRVIDGIPAYAQCTASRDAAIFSSDGVETGTASGGSGWLRTQFSGGYQCTELAHRYLAFRFKVTAVPSGDAGTWCSGSLPSGLVKATSPMHGDLIVLAPGSCGADATTGHVAVVDTVATDGTSLMAVQQNMASRGKYNLTCAACFLHAVANDGGSGAGGSGGLGAPDAGARDGATEDAASGAAGSSAAGRNGTAGSAGRGPVGSTGGAGVGGTVGSGGAIATGGNTGGSVTGGVSGQDAGAPQGPRASDGASDGGCAITSGTGDAASFSLLALAVLCQAARRRRRGHAPQR